MNETELIQGLRDADEQAYRQLVVDYRSKLFHIILNIVQDTVEAEDATQETFIQIFESIQAFKEESTLSTWIYRIATHKAIDKLRRKKSRQRLRQLLPWWMPEEQKSSQELFEHPGIKAENKEKASILFHAISLLPEKQRLAFTLIKVHGMSYQEACDILQQNIKAVESLVTRARINLQKELEDYYKRSK